MPHREQEAELAHPAPQEWQPALSLPSQSINPGGETQFQEFLNNLSPLQQEDPFSSFSPITGKDEAPISFPEQAEEETTASHPNPAHEQEGNPELDRKIKEGIEAAIESRFRSYSNRPSVAKRFPDIYFQNLDFTALAKLLTQELDVDYKSTDELLGLLKLVQNTKNIKSLIDDLLTDLNEKVSEGTED